MKANKSYRTKITNAQGTVIGGGSIQGGSFQQTTMSNTGSEVEWPQLIAEFDVLYQTLKAEAAKAGNPDSQLEELANLKEAFEFAKQKDKKGVIIALGGAGKWVLNAATAVGATLVASYLKEKLGIP